MKNPLPRAKSNENFNVQGKAQRKSTRLSLALCLGLWIFFETLLWPWDFSLDFVLGFGLLIGVFLGLWAFPWTLCFSWNFVLGVGLFIGLLLWAMDFCLELWTFVFYLDSIFRD